ncbi:hypothetical protein NA78x_000073 [Anatilimnocola sp. NA78]|uniref:hypothetical protein n=1 Tax=Anatilimnocola sp. NA78 TaxID=3415683 RepID=UPI003CE4E920
MSGIFLLMPLRVACTAGHLMMVPDHRAGTVLRCPKCGIEVQVPAAAGKGPLPTTAKPQVASAMQQSPQVAGHSTANAAAPAIAPPIIKPPPKARPKPTPPAEEKVSIVAKVTSDAAPPPADAVPAQPPQPAPPPVVAKTTPSAEDPALIETVELPPKPVAKKSSEPTKPKPSAVSPSQVSSNRPRATMTGTVLAPPVEPTPEPFFIGEEVSEPPLVHEPPVAAQPIAHEPIAHQPADAQEPYIAHEPAPVAPPIAVLLGVQPTASQRTTAWQIGAVLLAAALFSMGPAAWEIGSYFTGEVNVPVASWAFLLLMLGVVQIGGVILLVQVPDWSSVWIVTVQSLALAAIYAAALGLTIITSGDSPLISALGLDAQYASGKAPPWCMCMAAIYACAAFFAGRTSARWHKTLRQVQAAEQSALMY